MIEYIALLFRLVNVDIVKLSNYNLFIYFNFYANLKNEPPPIPSIL